MRNPGLITYAQQREIEVAWEGIRNVDMCGQSIFTMQLRHAYTGQALRGAGLDVEVDGGLIMTVRLGKTARTNRTEVENLKEECVKLKRLLETIKVIQLKDGESVFCPFCLVKAKNKKAFWHKDDCLAWTPGGGLK